MLQKKPIKAWDVNVGNIVIWKLVKTKANSMYLIGDLYKDIRPLVLIMPKKSGYVITFKAEDKLNKVISFITEDERLLEKHKGISTKIENLKNIELHALPVYDDRNIKTKIRTYFNKFCTTVCELNVSEDNIQSIIYKSFTVSSIDILLLYKAKHYLQVI